MKITENIGYSVEQEDFEVIYLPESDNYFARVEPEQEEEEGRPAHALSLREKRDDIIQKIEDTRARMQKIVDGCDKAIEAVKAIEQKRNES